MLDFNLGRDFVLEEIIKINKHNSSDLYKYILSYILLKTGTPLSALSISHGLMECFNVHTSHVSVRNKLKDLVNDGDVFKLEREYLKPHFIEGKDNREIEFREVYYVNLERNSFDDVYSYLKSICNKKTIPSKVYLKKRNELANTLIRKNSEIKSGVIVHYYTDESGVQKKKYFPIDFVIPNENLVIITTNSSNLFSLNKGNADKALINGIYHMKKTNMANFLIVGFSDNVDNEKLLGEFDDLGIEYKNYKDF
jgi:hypothetical protein